MYERFTDRARKVMQLANQEAQRFNHEHIGTEHVLLGLIREGGGVAASVFRNLGVDPRAVRLEVERSIPHGAGGGEFVMGRLPHTPRAKKAIEYAIEESRLLGHNYVGTEHLLLGLLREGQGVAAVVLTNLGLNLEAVREEVLKLLGDAPDRSAAAVLWDAACRLFSPAQQPGPEGTRESGRAVLDRHIDWLQRLMEKAVADRDVELAADVLGQLGELRTLRDRLADGT